MPETCINYFHAAILKLKPYLVKVQYHFHAYRGITVKVYQESTEWTDE